MKMGTCRKHGPQPHVGVCPAVCQACAYEQATGRELVFVERNGKTLLEPRFKVKT